ncbi:MAG TPA: TetR/AcrR family transcriptional regulator [Umezawaea sp.]|nr:TetR/AcrR family transcriptional regulator [Umezawaea sp.]
MPTVPTSRRERLRADLTGEIKTIAFRHIAEGGAKSLSLRGIAREMGMSAAALYYYFDTRDALLVSMAADVYTALAERMESACGACPADDVEGRLLAHGLTYREWAVTRPHEFRLLYGEASSADVSATGSAAAAAEHRVCLGLLGLVAAAWPRIADQHDARAYAWSDFDPDFVGQARTAHPGLPPAVIALTLRVWGRMHGLVALEVHGVLGPRARDALHLFRDELRDITRTLGLNHEARASRTPPRARG